MTASGRRLAVLGSPIAHSKSPALHAAAYGVLGLDWSYTALETTEETLAAVLEDPVARWHGLSLTMPLKHAVRPLLDEEDLVARATGAVNTVLLERDGSSVRRRGFNTDVAGIVRALGDAGVTRVDRVEVLGGGATAASAIAAAAELGASSVTATVRAPARAEPLRAVAETLGTVLEIRSFDEWSAGEPHPLVISTLPGAAAEELAVPDDVIAASTLFDVAYAPWPSPLAIRWRARRSSVVSGFGMLLHQALVQVRIFAGGDPTRTLPREDDVLAAMRAAVPDGS
ncbi:shikimate dehydrogenase [Rathayibacter sp. SD072]|uniref:shikimate dehydrogenase n=1 Tax=Rathayibacter sp. SD072 TaxID=2781731 RepID=UPI001A95D760|nr:shikimate dehydrogenase [Rathayibacter sp. SD072]MBO0982578.1 shikimate dehydrogenase [Rathayibacter sp. SD072]